MPQEPKKRHSRARQGKRRHAIKLTHANLSLCPNCGNKHVTHTVCPSCGFYKGKSTRTTVTPEKTDSPSTTSA